MDLKTLKMLDDFATGNLHPDLTILLDGDPEDMVFALPKELRLRLVS